MPTCSFVLVEIFPVSSPALNAKREALRNEKPKTLKEEITHMAFIPSRSEDRAKYCLVVGEDVTDNEEKSFEDSIANCVGSWVMCKARADIR